MRFIEKIKNVLKRFLPPPVRAFNREVERILAAIQSLSHKQDALAERAELLEDQNRALARQNEALAQQTADLSRQNESLAQQTAALAQQTIALTRQMESQREELAQARDTLTQQAETQRKELAQTRDALTQQAEEQRKELAQARNALTQQAEVQRKELAQAKDALISNMSDLSKTQTASLERSIRQVEDAIPNKKVFWNNPFEKTVVTANWGDVTEMPDFEEKFVKLIAGMDAQSVQAIIRILSRQKKYLHSDQSALDLFTRAEQEELRLLNENFHNEIYRVSAHLFAYRNYLLPVRHFESSVFYYRHGIDELDTRESVKGKAIIDVGGFIGDSVLVLSELNPSKIYTFEAEPGNFELLKKTIALNHVPNVIAENVALSAEAGTLTLHVAGSGTTSIERPGLAYKEDIQVPVITLDEYVEQNHIQVGLIKVDIEGGEPGFLAGAKRTICEQKPILLLSIYHNAHDFFELKPLIESWDLGYTFKIHKPTYGNATSETLLLAEVKQ